ncbi:MAG: GDSL-type esterase/lipase family protein [Isosphaeraceae bacterium]
MRFPRNGVTIAAFMLAISAAGSARADVVYLSLGDSVAFGYDPSTASTGVPSAGDQGYVRPFADYLRTVYGGVRPTVLNLGIVGEQTSSFFDPSTASPYGPPRYWQLNTNYANETTSQNSLMLSQIAAIHARGGQVGFASLIFGANDIFALTNDPAFTGGTPAQQQALLTQRINAALGKYVAALTELKTYAPEARVVLPGYYNPFPAAILPENHAFYDMVLGIYNPAVQSIAAQFGATYVDTYSLFAGKELAMTNIATGDFHPNQAGYNAIAGAMIRAVPEPSSIAMLALALAATGAAMLARRRIAA